MFAFRSYISTWFQPTYSRLLMPNFDDPWFKAALVVKIKYPQNANVYSNQQIDQVTKIK